MAAYTAALSVGFALGPFTLSLVGTQGGTAYWIGAGFSILALMCLAMPGIAQPVFDGPADANPLRFIMLAPLAMAATVLHATVESAGLSFLALYAVKLGWLETEATQLMSCMMVGAIMLQLPIGWLGDKLDRRRMIIVLAGLAVIGALVWPWALLSPWTTYPLLFVWGGVFVGIYTIMLTIVGSRFSGSQLVGIYAAMGLMWGAGALIGPVFAGVAMQGLTHGLPLFVALACTCFMCAAICSPARDDQGVGVMLFVFLISDNSRAIATKPDTGTVSARRVTSTSAAAASRSGSTPRDFRLCRSILRRWLKAAAATCSSRRRSQASGSARGTRRTTDDVTFGGGVKAAGEMSNRILVSARQFDSTPSRP